MIKFFHSGMTGAPVLSGTDGALKGVLKACLCDGFGAKTPSSVVITSGVAVFTVSGGHTFFGDMVALVAGVTVTGGALNGDRRVLATTTNTISVDATGLANQTASLSTASIKVSPLGWAEQFAGTANKFAVKSAQVDSTGFCLRLDDTGTKSGRVVGYELMTDIDTGARPFPTTAQMSGGLHWVKSSEVNTNPHLWTIVGDEYGFYYCPAQSSQNGADKAALFFGDPKSAKQSDPYGCVLTGVRSDVYGGDIFEGDLATARYDRGGGKYFARNQGGIGGAIDTTAVAGCNMIPESTDRYSGTTAYGWGYPNVEDNGLMLAPLLIREMISTLATVRGRYPGIYHIPQVVTDAFPDNLIQEGAGDFTGKKMLMVKTSRNDASAGTRGFVAFDITGPWR